MLAFQQQKFRVHPRRENRRDTDRVAVSAGDNGIRIKAPGAKKPAQRRGRNVDLINQHYQHAGAIPGQDAQPGAQRGGQTLVPVLCHHDLYRLVVDHGLDLFPVRPEHDVDRMRANGQCVSQGPLNQRLAIENGQLLGALVTTRIAGREDQDVGIAWQHTHHSLSFYAFVCGERSRRRLSKKTTGNVSALRLAEVEIGLSAGDIRDARTVSSAAVASIHRAPSDRRVSKKQALLQDPPFSFLLKNRLESLPPVTWVRRKIRPRQADIFLLSYPKTGRTWLRVMMGKMLAEHFGRPELLRLEADPMVEPLPGIPRIVAKHDGKPQTKTATEIIGDKSEYADCKVVLLIRDLRDTIVSNYFQATRRKGRFVGDISTFLHWPRGSFDGLLRYYNVWAAQRGVPLDFLLLRYEDLHEDAERELRRVAGFMELSGVSDETIRGAVEHARFGAMKAREAARPADGSALAAARAGDAESFKTRRGKVGGYQDYLSKENIAWLNARIDAELDRYYGYTSAPLPGPVGSTDIASGR